MADRHLLSSLVAFLSAKFHSIEPWTSRSYIASAGVLSTRNIIIPYTRVTEASYTQTLSSASSGVGNLIIATAGRRECGHPHA